MCVCVCVCVCVCTQTHLPVAGRHGGGEEGVAVAEVAHAERLEALHALRLVALVPARPGTRLRARACKPRDHVCTLSRKLEWNWNRETYGWNVICMRKAQSAVVS